MRFINRIDPRTNTSENRHVLAFFGVVKRQNGESILLTEFIEGQELDKGFEALGPIKYTYLRWIVPQIFDGLKFLHSKGIAHRDIKPENIMLQQPLDYGGVGRVVLIDLGLACVLDGNQVVVRVLDKFSCDENLTGSPRFISPWMSELYTRDNNDATLTRADEEKNDIWAAALSILLLLLSEEEVFRPYNHFVVDKYFNPTDYLEMIAVSQNDWEDIFTKLVLDAQAVLASAFFLISSLVDQTTQERVMEMIQTVVILGMANSLNDPRQELPTTALKMLDRIPFDTQGNLKNP